MVKINHRKSKHYRFSESIMDLFAKRNNMSTTFSQQILSDRLLLIVTNR